jgi:hypothetical protein
VRWLPLLGFSLLGIALAGCGGGKKSATATTTATGTSHGARLTLAGLQPPPGCYVTVFLVEDATPAQVRSVQNRLLRNKAATNVSFVSRGLALERFMRKNPAVAKGMKINPFSDQFEVVPRNRAAIFAIIGDFAIHGGPITNAKPSNGCAATG